MRRIKIYRLLIPGGWWLVPCEGSSAVAAEIDPKYKLELGVRDRRLLVFKLDKNSGGLTVDEAIQRGIIRLLETK